MNRDQVFIKRDGKAMPISEVPRHADGGEQPKRDVVSRETIADRLKVCRQCDSFMGRRDGCKRCVKCSYDVEGSISSYQEITIKSVRPKCPAHRWPG